MPLTRRLRPAVIAALALAVAAAALALFLRRALDGDALRSAAETQLSSMLGQPVTIAAMDIDLFPRAAVVGTGIRVGRTPKMRAPALEIGRIALLPRLRTLVGGPIVIQDLRLDGLVVSVLRDRDGGWHVPAAVPAPGADKGAGVVIDRVQVTRGRVVVFDEADAGTLREASSIDDIGAQVALATGGLQFSPVTGRIGGARISGQARTDAAGAHLEFTAGAIADADLPALLGLLGSTRPEFLRLHESGAATVALRIDRATSVLAGRGRLRAAQVGLEPLRLQAFDAPFTLDRNRLAFDQTAFTLYGGTHRGSIDIDLNPTPPRWRIDSHVSRLRIGDFLNALTATDARIDGMAVIAATLRGPLNESLAETLTGRVQLTVEDGVIRQFPLLAAVNRAVRLTASDGPDTRFERLTATLALARGQAATDDLRMYAGHVRVEAAGRIGFDRSLDMTGKAVLSAERATAAIRSVHELSGLRNRNGELEIPLTIAGTLDAPSFNLDLQAMIRKGIQDELKRRLRNIIRR
ncbi:MAG TPA: AsmA-like C-terminal region-containing protein [Vicinamibacterales bacterium]|nr:AsmA-like C-terminal region-containing protein [Vicinamibacterales bacterium]